MKQILQIFTDEKISEHQSDQRYQRSTNLLSQIQFNKANTHPIRRTASVHC